MTPSRARRAAVRMLHEFEDSAAIETANTDLCAFIMAAARLILARPDIAKALDEYMAEEDTRPAVTGS